MFIPQHLKKYALSVEESRIVLKYNTPIPKIKEVLQYNGRGPLCIEITSSENLLPLGFTIKMKQCNAITYKYVRT